MNENTVLRIFEDRQCKFVITSYSIHYTKLYEGPILSLLKELSSVPGIKQLAGKSQNKGPNNEYNYKFSLMCTKLFQGTLT